jgi:hypothetical protein
VDALGPEEKRKGAASQGSKVEEGEGTMHIYAVISLFNCSYILR